MQFHNIIIIVICDHPSTQSLHDPVIVIMESDIPNLNRRTVHCIYLSTWIHADWPKCFSMYRNGEWEPDPGQVDCIGA